MFAKRTGALRSDSPEKGDGQRCKFSNTSRFPIKAWIDGVECDEVTRWQLDNIASLPYIHSDVAAMPDVHFGIGATVGSVIATKSLVRGDV